MKEDIDIDSLRTEHESDEQWAVRRSFMAAHKDKFSETELVTLAQLFTNIEFLGCRYNKQVMEDITCLANNILTERHLKKHLFGFETEHWSKKYIGNFLSRMPWIISNIECMSHLKCAANKRWLKTNARDVKVQRQLIAPKVKKIKRKEPSVTERQRKQKECNVTTRDNWGKDISVRHKGLAKVGKVKALQPPRKAKPKEEDIGGQRKLNLAKLLDDLGKKINTLKVGKETETLKDLEQTYTKEMTQIDNNLERRINKHNRLRFDEPQSSSSNSKKYYQNQTLTKDKSLTKNVFVRELHPLLRENTAFVISKDNSDTFDSQEEVTNVFRLLMEFLRGTLEIPESDIRCFGRVTNNTEILFAVKNVNAAKFIINKFLDEDNKNYVIQRYNFVKAAIVIPNEPKYLKKNMLLWLEYLNNHVDIKPTVWTKIYEEVEDNMISIIVTMPRSDAVGLHKSHNKLDYIDVKVKIVLFPKAKKYPRPDLHVTNKNNKDNYLETSTSKEDKTVDEELVIFRLPNNCEFGENPLSDIKVENSVDFKWREIYMNYYKNKMVVAMSTTDAVKLKCRKKRLKYCKKDLDVRFPDSELDV